jgi:phosphatidate phosphatase APP1
MHYWPKPIQYVYKRVKNPFARLNLYIKQRMDWLGKPKILPYIGFGNQSIIYVRGRIVEGRGLAISDKENSIWNNFSAMLKRYMSNEIPHVKLKAEFNGQAHIAESNEYGEFEFNFTLLKPLPQGEIWHLVAISLIDEAFCDVVCETAFAEVMVAIPESQYGVISDIDDTILISHSTSFLKKLRLMLLKNASTRLPFEGVAAFYRALHSGGQDNHALNPLFYVSSSEWNLYDLLVDFCDHQKIPKGMFLLHDLKVGLLKLFRSGKGKHDHKILKIKYILETYKNINFILIGDSGQKDPEIYQTIIEAFPNRIKAVYIRDIGSKSRYKEVNRIANEIHQSYQIDMLQVKDTEAAALHAIDKGWITSTTLHDIARERYKNQYSKTQLLSILKGNKKKYKNKPKKQLIEK